MASRLGTFHWKHGHNIQLSEEATVAHRVQGFRDGVVFTEQPIPLGSVFQVKLMNKVGRWAGSIVSDIILELKK